MTKAKRSHPLSDRPRRLHICLWTWGSRYESLPFYAPAVSSSAGSSMGHLPPDLSTKSLKSHLSRGLEAGDAAVCNKGDVLGGGGHCREDTWVCGPDQISSGCTQTQKGLFVMGSLEDASTQPPSPPSMPQPRSCCPFPLGKY